MAKCRVCGYRLADGVAKCPMCGAEAGSTVAGEISESADLPQYKCPSCGEQIVGEHRYCPNCGVNIKEAAQKVVEAENLSEQNEMKTTSVETDESFIEIVLQGRRVVRKEGENAKYYCPKCHQRVSLDSTACGNCNTSLVASSQNEESPQKENESIVEQTASTESNAADKAKIAQLTEEYQKVSKNRKLAWVLFVIAAVALVGFIPLWNESKDELSKEKVYSSFLFSSFSDLLTDWNNSLSSPVHVVINRVYNEANNSESLDHTKITFLDFSYTVLKANAVSNSEKIYVKILQSNGDVMTGNSSPQGFTTSVDANSYWSGWGSSTAGSAYSSGDYAIEFWYKDACVGRKLVHIN